MQNFVILVDEGVETTEDHGCPKVQDLSVTDEELWICSSYSFRQKTLPHDEERKAKVFGNWTVQRLKLYIF